MKKSKLSIALDSIVESLVYMTCALLTFLCAYICIDVLEWWMLVILCVAVTLVLAYTNYIGKIYGFVFEEEEDIIE